MTIPIDKIQHFILGLIAIVCAILGIYIYQRFGIGPTYAYTSTTVGILYEIQQGIRKEGEPSPLDAMATAAPGYLAWLAHAQGLIESPFNV